jgi:hypothetical protein
VIERAGGGSLKNGEHWLSKASELSARNHSPYLSRQRLKVERGPSGQTRRSFIHWHPGYGLRATRLRDVYLLEDALDFEPAAIWPSQRQGSRPEKSGSEARAETGLNTFRHGLSPLAPDGRWRHRYLLRSYSSTLVREIITDQRTAIRNFLQDGLAQGANPKETAIDLVGYTSVGRCRGRAVKLDTCEIAGSAFPDALRLVAAAIGVVLATPASTVEEQAIDASRGASTCHHCRPPSAKTSADRNECQQRNLSGCDPTAMCRLSRSN